MKIDDIREMSVTDLHEKLEELRVELFNLRFQKSKNLLDLTDRLRIVRRNIARINTVLNAKEER